MKFPTMKIETNPPKNNGSPYIGKITSNGVCIKTAKEAYTQFKKRCSK